VATLEHPTLTAGAIVRLVLPLDDVPEGTSGHIIGFYRHPEYEAVAVKFHDADGTETCVPAEALELV
jgi:hypothetical protein